MLFIRIHTSYDRSIVYELNLLKLPDLVLAFPLSPKGNGGAGSGVTVVGQINVLVGLLNEDAAIHS